MRALALVALLVLGSAAVADAGGARGGFYIGGPVGTFAPPPPPAGQPQPHFYIGGPVGTYAPPARYSSSPSCVAPGYWTYAFVPDPVSGGYYQPVWIAPRALC
jgi:hypothetical protein